MALDFVAGCVGGCAGVIVGHPLDTVKVHLQTQTGSNPRYAGTVHCFRSLLAREGARGLYRGMTSPLAGVAAINAIVFGVYGNIQKRLSEPEALKSHMIAGGAAGFVQSFFCAPMELAKSRLQVSNSNQSPLRCLLRIFNTEGARGVFRGLGITILREVPAFGSYFVTYEFLTRRDDDAAVSTATMLTAGGVAGVISWLIVYPVDVLKSRVQIDEGRYKGAYDCLKKSLASDGYSFLYRGLSPTLIRAFPVNAATFTVVTWTMRLFSDSEVLDRSGGLMDAAVYSLKVSEAA